MSDRNRPYRRVNLELTILPEKAEERLAIPESVRSSGGCDQVACLRSEQPYVMGSTTMLLMREDEALVTVATFETELEASFARGALEAIGIPALVPGETRGSFKGLYSGIGLGRPELKVFESDRDRALVELQRMQIRIVEPNHESH